MSDTQTSPDEKTNGPAETVFFKIPMAIIGTLILVGIAINFSNVVSRYIFQTAIFWAEEILIFIVVWSVFIGAVAVAYQGAHLKMDLLSARIGQPWKTLINALTIISLILCGIFAILQSIEVLKLLGNNGQLSVTAEVPMVIPHSAILIGFVLIVLAVIVRWRAYMRGDFE